MEGISKNTVHKREQAALCRLRHPSRSKALRVYL
ncbi:MAG: hypothetical protein HFF42_11025 [Lawsonibacter sp.]|nr:hypothetical protein [Lawsonibacter sp.]